MRLISFGGVRMQMLALTALTLFPWPVGDCPSCAFEPKQTVLCGVHRAEEQELLAKWKPKLKQASAAERIEALEAVAASTGEHANAPSPKVAEFLALGLADDDLDVRRRVLGMLLDGQHPESTVAALIEALAGAQREWKSVSAAYAELSALPFGKTKPVSKEEWARQMTTPKLVEDVLAALGKVPDQRCMRALTDFLDEPWKDTPGRFYVAAANAQLELQTRAGVEAVIEFLPRAAIAVRRGKTGPIYPRDPSMQGLKTLLDAIIDTLAPLEEKQLEAIAARLGEVGAAASCTPVPQDVASASDWASWWSANSARFPVGDLRLQAPLHAKLQPPPAEEVAPGTTGR